MKKTKKTKKTGKIRVPRKSRISKLEGDWFELMREAVYSKFGVVLYLGPEGSIVSTASGEQMDEINQYILFEAIQDIKKTEPEKYRDIMERFSKIAK